jgi:hypothetical protein
VDAPKAEEMKGVAATKAANRGEKTLQQLYAEHDGKVSDKWSLYLAEYERIFAPYRDRPVRILEIGIENGGSLELWSKYFWNATKIIGCDINRDCAQLQYDDPRVSIVVGNANGARTRKRIMEHCDCFDIIIDDASHQSKDIIFSFTKYFSCLNDGGLYVAEDLHCSYWQEFMGGLYHPGSSLAFFKLLVDVVNREHWGLDKARSELMLHLEEHYQLHFTEGLLRKVHSLEFLNSLCFIKKQDGQNNVLGPRVVSGRTEAIAPIRLLNGTRSAQPDQRGNKWTRPQNIDERTVLRAERLHVELGVMGEQLAEKEAALARVTGERDALGQTIEAMAAAHSDETERLRADLSVAVKQLAEKEAALACIVGERDTLTQTAEAAAAVHAEETQRLRDEIGVVSDQLAEKEAALERVAGERDTLAQTAVAAAATHAEETQGLRAHLDALRQRLAEKEATLARVAGERDALEQTVESIAAAHADETQRLRADLSVAAKQLAEKEATLARVAGERDALAQAAEKASSAHEVKTRSGSVDHQNLELESASISWPAREVRRVGKLLRWTAKFRLVGQFQMRRRRLRERRVILSSGLFDGDWYLAQNPDVRVASINPLLHYVRHGAAEGRNPNPQFNANRYLAQNPDVRAAGINPLLHYIRHGAAEGRNPNPQLNANWHLAQNLDVQAADIKPLLPHVQSGPPEGRDSNPPPQLEEHTVYDVLNARFGQLKPIHIYRMPETEARVTMVTDSINAGSLYGGVGTAMIFCALLASRLGSSLRVVTRTQRPDRKNLQKILAIHGVPLPPSVEFVHADVGALGRSLDVRKSDIFVTTSWWTTRAVERSIPAEQIVHIIQEDERMFYPYGDDHLLCHESLSNPSLRFVVNSRLLFEHFSAEGLEAIVKNGAWFEPAFPESHYYSEDREPSKKLNFVFYARRRNHDRNLYYRGIEAVDASVAAGILDPDRWDFTFVGAHLERLTLADSVRPALLQNLEWVDYLRLMRASDLGLALMYTPHPSYPPLDLVACGAVAATNKFGMKTSLESYSSNIICSDLDSKSLLNGLERGSILAQDRARRRANYLQNSLSRSWQASFENALDFVAGS